MSLPLLGAGKSSPSAPAAPTRLYFSDTGTPGISPAVDAGWASFLNLIRRSLLSAKSGGEGFTSLLPGQVGVTPRCHLQAISAPLAAQTISGTIKLQMRTRFITGSPTSQQGARVLSGDGTIVRGTLLAVGQYGPATTYAASLRNKTFADGDALTPVVCQAGDVLVVEVGHDSAGLHREMIEIGAPSGTADLPEDEVEATQLVPWVEFSASLVFQ